ncbi:MAG: isochorismatase family protein [Cytophagales bacterium]|nr:isochorismatase family protein [Rhizobacter sp.]
MNTALIVIDVQESFRHSPYWSERELPAFMSRTNALIEGCVSGKVPIVRILHVDGDKAFSLAAGHVRPLEGLAAFTAAAEFHKNRHSALVGTGLMVWLHKQRINRLIVAGIRTEQCCETTTRHASDEGFEVDYVAEATLTFDMKHLDGSQLLSSDIVARTTAVLSGRFATICSVEQALERAQSR